MLELHVKTLWLSKVYFVDADIGVVGFRIDRKDIVEESFLLLERR